MPFIYRLRHFVGPIYALELGLNVVDTNINNSIQTLGAHSIIISV